MKFRNSMRLDNAGLTITELLIAVAIAGIVGASVFGFMTIGAKSFSYNSADVSIQNEQQMAFNQIQDLVIDTAVGVEYYDKTDNAKVDNDSEIPDGHDKLLRLNNYDSVYEIWWDADESKLFYSEFTASINASNEVEKGTQTVADALMSEYIKSFVIDLSRLISNRVVRVDLGYEKNQRVMVSSHNITLRNQVVSSNVLEEHQREAVSLSSNIIPDNIKGKKIIYAEPGDSVNLKNVYDSATGLTGYHVYDTEGNDITNKQPLGYGFTSASAHRTTAPATQIGYSSGILTISKAETAGSIMVLVYCTGNNTYKLPVEVRVVRTTGVSVNFIKGTGCVDEIVGGGDGDDIYANDLIVNETFSLEAIPNISWTTSNVPAAERDSSDTSKLTQIENNIKAKLSFKGVTGYDTLFKATGSLTGSPCEFKMSGNFTFGSGEASYYTAPIAVRAYCKYSLDKFGGDQHKDWDGSAYRKKADFNISFSSDLKRGKPNHIYKSTDTFTCAKGIAGDFWTNHVQLLEVVAIERNYNQIDPDTGMPAERLMEQNEYIRSFDGLSGSNEGNTNTWICPVEWKLDCEYEFMFTMHIAHAKSTQQATKGIYVLPYGGYTEADYEYTSNTSEPVVFNPFSITFNPTDKYNNVIVRQNSDTAQNTADKGNHVTYYARNFGEYLPRGTRRKTNNSWQDDPVRLPVILNDQFTYRTDVWAALMESKSTANSNYKWKVYEPSGEGGSSWSEYTNRNYICDYNMDQNDINKSDIMFRYYVAQDNGGYLNINTYIDKLNRNIPSRLRICPDIYWQDTEYNDYFVDSNYVECVFWNVKVPHKSILGKLYESTGWGSAYDTCFFPGPDDDNFPGAKENAIWYYAGYGDDAGYETLTADDGGTYYNLRYSLSKNNNLDGTARWRLRLLYEDSAHEIKEIATYNYNYSSRQWELGEQ